MTSPSSADLPAGRSAASLSPARRGVVAGLGGKIALAWDTVAIAVVLLVIVATGLGSLARLIGTSRMSWSFELTAIAFVWLTALGTVMAERRGENVAVELLDRFLPPAAMRLVRLVRAVLVAVIAAGLVFSTWAMLGRSAFIPSPVMRLPLWVLHSSILVLGIGVAVLQIRTILRGGRTAP